MTTNPAKTPLRSGRRKVPTAKLAALIVEGRWTDMEMGEMLGASNRLVSKWRRLPAVVKAVARIEKAAADRVGRHIASLQATALDEVRKLLESDDTAQPVRLAAAKIVLDMGTKRPATVVEHTGRIDLSSVSEDEVRRRAEAIQREIAEELARAPAGEA